MGVDGEEGSLQKVCFSAGNEAEGLDLEEQEQRKRRRPSVSLPASLGSGLYVSKGWSWRAGIKQLRRRRSGDVQEMWLGKERSKTAASILLQN